MARKDEKENPAQPGGCIAVIRIRGRSTTSSGVEETLLFMNLSRKNHATILPADAISAGMVRKAKDFITWGTPSGKAVAELLAKAGKTADGKPLTDAYVKEKAGFASIEELAEQLHSGKARLSSAKSVKPVFRLHPPKGGFGSIKRAFPKGALGRRVTADIEKLIFSMAG